MNWTAFEESAEWQAVKKFLDDRETVALKMIGKPGMPERESDTLRGQLVEIEVLRRYPATKAQEAKKDLKKEK